MQVDYSGLLSTFKARRAAGLFLQALGGEVFLMPSRLCGKSIFSDTEAFDKTTLNRVLEDAKSNHADMSGIRRLLNDVTSGVGSLGQAELVDVARLAIERDQIHGLPAEDVPLVWLYEELPTLWAEAYRGMPEGKSEFEVFSDQRYTYQFDIKASRVIAAYGAPKRKTSPRQGSERQARQKEFLGRATTAAELERIRNNTVDKKSTGALRQQQEALSLQQQAKAQLSFTERYPGYERGHYMSDQQGGLGDCNLFPQLQRVNRAREWRAMEEQCASDPDVVFCFQRPIYDDASWIPVRIEYGIVSRPDHFTLNTFANK